MVAEDVLYVLYIEDHMVAAAVFVHNDCHEKDHFVFPLLFIPFLIVRYHFTPMDARQRPIFNVIPEMWSLYMSIGLFLGKNRFYHRLHKLSGLGI